MIGAIPFYLIFIILSVVTVSSPLPQKRTVELIFTHYYGVMSWAGIIYHKTHISMQISRQQRFVHLLNLTGAITTQINHLTRCP